MTVLQVCAFAAPNPGSFIASVTYLETLLSAKGIRTIYAFSEEARQQNWCKQIQLRTKVYFLPTAKARILPQTYLLFRRIYKENQIDVVHSHFELYDIPATVTAPKGVRVFWHLHDPIVIGRGLHALLWRIQYGIIGRRAMLLSVAEKYRQEAIALGFPAEQTKTILNGIDTQRIVSNMPRQMPPEFDFLTFGWDFYRKGVDLILQACNRLAREGYEFRFLLNGNQQTWSILENYLQGSSIPDYLVCGDPVEDVTLLFSQSGVFVQASRQETFSYAVCEAAYAGLPVICSDIPGHEWAHELPTVKFFSAVQANSLYMLMKSHLDHNNISQDAVACTQSIIREKFSVEVWAEHICEAYGL